jgi:hypothetical protein
MRKKTMQHNTMKLLRPKAGAGKRQKCRQAGSRKMQHIAGGTSQNRQSVSNPAGTMDRKEQTAARRGVSEENHRIHAQG